MKTLIIRGLWLLLPVALAGCPNNTPKPQPIPPAGQVKSFTAAPATLAAPGDKTTLKWETQDATTVSLEEVGKGPLTIDAKAASGSLEVALSKDALFVLTARGPGGTDSMTTAVTVTGGSQGLVFDALPRTIGAGGSTTLVWSAPGATAVTVTPAGGAALDLSGQVQSGSVRVSLLKSTRFELDADGKKATVDVTVGIAIFDFSSEQPAPLPGKPVTLSWETSGGTSLVLKREGAAAPLLTETDPVKIGTDSYSEMVLATAPVDGLLHYTLELTQGTQTVSRALTVRIGGSVSIDQFVVPNYVRPNTAFNVAWKTTGGERLDLFRDGMPVYQAPNAAAVAQNTYPITGPATGMVKIKLRLSNSTGAVVEKEETSTVIAPPTFVSFTANPMSIAAGGTSVTLSWNVTNARHVKITDNGTTVLDDNKAMDTGSVAVYPNRAITTYLFNADNGAGDAIAPQMLMITVTNPGVLTFSAQVPVGGQSSITGHTVTGGTQLVGLPNVKKNVAGDGFIDISATGTLSGVTGDTSASVITIGNFTTRIFGRAVSTDSVSIAPNGFLVLGNVAQSGPTTPTTPIGTQLVPLAIVPVLKDLNCIGPCKVTWQLDNVGTGVDAEQRLIVQWTDVALYVDSAAISTFQAQIYSRGKVVFAYQKIAGNLVAYGVGVVNNTETDVLAPAALPVAGDSLTFFAETTPPVPVKVEALPYTALVRVTNGWVEVQGSGLLAPNQIGISEINPRPAAGVTNGQWVEVANYTGTAFNLNGWVLDFGAGSTHTIASNLMVPANGRVLLAQTSDLGQAGSGITADYVYGTTFTMAATGTLTLNISGTVYSKFIWDALTAPTLGVSVHGDAPQPTSVYASAANQASCPSTGGATWGAANQVGTPGGPNPPCFPYVFAKLDGGSFESIADAGTPVILADAGTSATDEVVYPLTLASPAKYYGAAVPTVYVGTNGWISTVATTGAAITNRTVPANTAPIGTIAPFWDDLQGNNPSATSGIYSLRRDPDGTPGNGDEYTIVSWEDWRVYGAVQSLNFQVKLFDNGNIEYHYGSMTGVSTSTQGSSATSWLEDKFGKSAAPININSATAPGIQPNTGFRYSYVP